MSLEHQLPVLMKKTQMSGERAQCGLTSLLPMSCRGRAEAFARRLHTRLRNLGGGGDDAGESRWLASHDLSSATRRDSDLFFDFELECESPSSPVDEYDAPFADRSPSDDVPFYDVDSEPDLAQRVDAAKLRSSKKQPDAKPKTSPPPVANGFTFSSAFYTDHSPIKSQPAPRENGHADGRLYSAITLEGCERCDLLAKDDDVDETDFCTTSNEIQCLPSVCSDTSRLPVPFSSVDSDSDFESAKSFDVADEAIEDSTAHHRLDDDAASDRLSEFSLRLEDPTIECSRIEVVPIIDEVSVDEVCIGELSEVSTLQVETSTPLVESSKSQIDASIPTLLEIKTDEVPSDKEASPAREEDPTLLCAEAAALPDETAREAEEETEERPQRVRRCSSLKTGKTPPGTPGRKKIVRFADVLGLDLADVKTFMDEIPVIPKSAYEDLANADLAIGSPPTRSPAQRLGGLSLVPLFQTTRDMTESLEARCVCLESARVADGAHITVCGSVRVRNLDFHKTVHVRYTMDGWKTYTDLQATYVPGSCDGFSDRFQFLLYASSITAGQRLEIAVRFQCKGRQYWDNNFGVNYCFDCLPLGGTTLSTCAVTSLSAPLHPTVDWHPSFY